MNDPVKMTLLLRDSLKSQMWHPLVSTWVNDALDRYINQPAGDETKTLDYFLGLSAVGRGNRTVANRIKPVIRNRHLLAAVCYQQKKTDSSIWAACVAVNAEFSRLNSARMSRLLSGAITPANELERHLLEASRVGLRLPQTDRLYRIIKELVQG